MIIYMVTMLAKKISKINAVNHEVQESDFITGTCMLEK